MKCKHSVGNCHIWVGELKEEETQSKYVTCGNCGRSSGNKDLKGQLKDLTDWAIKASKNPDIDNPDYYLGVSGGTKTILSILGDFDVILV